MPRPTICSDRNLKRMYRWLCHPQPTILLRKQDAQNPGFRKDVGVFLVRSEPEDRGQVAAQHDRQLGLVRHKRHLIDQRSEHFSRLGLVVLAVQALIVRSDPLAVDLRHVRMQEGRWLLRVCQQLGQFCLAGFKTTNFVLELMSARDTIQDSLDRSIQVPLERSARVSSSADSSGRRNTDCVHSWQ